MIITQKYHSSQEIDPEFIDSLEELMREHVPSFEWIKAKEKLAPENIHYSYYLFFGNSKNSPIGYAQASIKNEERSKTVKGLFFNKKETERVKDVIWTAPTSSEEGIVFDPAFLKGGLAKTDEIFREYNQRKEVLHQEAKLGDEALNSFRVPNNHSEKIVNCLVKSKATYKDYIEDLDPKAQKQIKSLWKEVFKNRDWRVGEYDSFKNAFAYKKEGSKQYKELRKNQELAPYAQQADLFLTLESSERIFAWVFLFYGSHGQVFIKTASLSDVSHELLTQTAIMRFFEDRESSKLRYMERVPYSDTLASWGFTSKSISTLELKAK